jgi:hypothetical protein
MKRHLLFLLILITSSQLLSAQYQYAKPETIDFINDILKLRANTTLYKSLPKSKNNHVIVLQELSDKYYIQIRMHTDHNKITDTISHIDWNAFRAFGYNDNRSELYIYFNKKLMVNDIPKDAFSMYIPEDKVDNIKNDIMHLVEITRLE